MNSIIIFFQILADKHVRSIAIIALLFALSGFGKDRQIIRMLETVNQKFALKKLL